MPKQVWQAEDGTQFENEKDCLLYERFSKELCKRAIPQEIRNLPNGETSHSIAKNFYSILSSVHEIVSFLESVELIVAPNEKMIRERKEKEKQDLEAEKDYETKYGEGLKALKWAEYEAKRELEKKKDQQDKLLERKMAFLEDEVIRKRKFKVWEKIKDSEPKGPMAVGYWEELHSRKVKLNDQNYAKLATLFKKFHEGKIKNNEFDKELNKQLSIDEICAIYRDIEFNHKEFAW